MSRPSSPPLADTESNAVSQGIRVLAESFRRAVRPGGHAAWEAERPSLAAGLAREAILKRCGTLDDAPTR